jgi:hypothetical protein
MQYLDSNQSSAHNLPVGLIQTHHVRLHVFADSGTNFCTNTAHNLCARRNKKRHSAMHENQHDMQLGVPLASQKLWNKPFPLQIGLSEKV